METHKTFCRFCHACCAIELDVEDGVPIKVRGDAKDPVYGGYTCIKGRELPAQYTNPDRIRCSSKRHPDGVFSPIDTDTALDEISAKIEQLIADHGPRSVATYLGTYGYQNSPALAVGKAWHDSIGSSSWYTSVTIDQPGKRIAASRIGSWAGGFHKFTDADVCMIIGSNVVVSQYSRFGGPPPFSPYARIRDEMKKGMQLIVVDPRVTEVANRASLHLQIDPGQDATLLCGMIRLILSEGLHDAAFCDQYVDGLQALRQQVEPFTPIMVAQRCGIPAADMEKAARTFANANRGIAVGGTGPAMASNNILTEHLILTLNYICGRVNRAGDRFPNPGVTTPEKTIRAEVIAAKPVHGFGPKARVRGLGEIFGEMPTATLSDEILLPGDGQIKALICLGGNPIVAFPDQEKTRRAMETLELLVCVDLYQSATADFADYIIAPTITLEREDVTMLTDSWYDVPYGNYTHAVLPRDEQTREEWEIFWELSHRSGIPIELPGGTLDPAHRPSKLDVLKLVAPQSRVSLDTMRERASGHIYDDINVVIEPGESDARLQLMPGEVAGEIAGILAPPDRQGGRIPDAGNTYSHLLISRRLKHVFNSSGQQLDNLRAKGSTNPAYMNPSDMTAMGISSGDLVEIESSAGQLVGVAESASDIKQGVVSMSHGWGGIPGNWGDVRERGASTNRLVDDDKTFDAITGQPRMSAIPVNLRKVAEGTL